MKTPICPFCQKEMARYYDMFQIFFDCQNAICYMKPYRRYALHYNKDDETLRDAYIILELNNKFYCLTISHQYNHTSIDFLWKNQDEYYLPTDLLDLPEILFFDLNNPIQSGTEILERLLKLKAFY